MSEHDEYDEWDAAYVLGALSPAQRREFEDHLVGCPLCARAVDDLAAIPGLLGELSEKDAFATIQADTGGGQPSGSAPAGILTGLITRVRRRRRVRTWTIGVLGIAAAATIVAAIVLPITVNAPTQPTVAASLQQVIASPISANIQLTGASWGTKIALTCHYRTAASAPSSPRYRSTERYGLYVIDRTGASTRVSSWAAGPGAIVQAAGSIETPVAAIDRVELRSLDTGSVLLTHTFNTSDSN